MKYVKFLIVALVVIVVFAYFLIFQVPATEKESITSQVGDDASSSMVVKSEVKEPFSGNGTMDSLRLLNKDLECTIIYKPIDEGDEVEGTYFVSEGNIRGDFLTSSPDLEGQILSSVIMDETNLYSWSEIEGQTYGVKVSLTEIGSDEGQLNTPVSFDSVVQYDCKPWENVDGSVFLPPSKVLFRDMSELQKAGMEYGTTYEIGEEMPIIPE